jgi:hypothetical protein
MMVAFCRFERKRQSAVRPAPRLRRLDHNVDIPAQPGQAFQQPMNWDAFNADESRLATTLDGDAKGARSRF